jgi:4-hydroxybenzoyl-CoA thioesterase
VPEPFRHRRVVRFADCDPAGIVYFPRYFDMFHEAIEDWYRLRLEIDYWSKLRDARIGFPAVHTSCDFLRPSFMGDLLELEVRIERIGTRSLSLRIDVWCGAERRVEGKLVSVLTSLDSHGSIDIPADLRAAYERYEEACRASAS